MLVLAASCAGAGPSRDRHSSADQALVEQRPAVVDLAAQWYNSSGDAHLSDANVYLFLL